MKKKFTFLIAALMLLMMITQPTRLWGQTTYTYKLVTNANQLSANDKIIIASGINATSTPNTKTAIGAANSNSNRKAVSVSVSNNIITTEIDNGNETTSGANTANDDLTKPLEITLVSSNTNYTFKEILSNGDVFLNGGAKKASGSGNNNYLKANASAETSTGNGKYNGVWGITINNSTYIATIKNQNNFAIKLNGSLFASYSSGSYTDVYIYKKAYTVTYDANGGTGTLNDDDSPYFMNSTVTTKTNSFTRDGYSFNGWNTASDGSGTGYAEGATFTISANTTLFAQWLATSSNPTITINTPTGGTITVEDDDDNTISDGDQIAEGTSLYINATPAEGYSFDEWSVTETSSGEDIVLLNGTDEAKNAFDMPDVDVTIDATFTKSKYNVAVLSVDYITITASYGVSNTITEGNNADVDYQTSISLSASGVTTGKDYDWKITNSSDGDVTASVLSGTTVTVPAYNIKIGATIVDTYTVTYNANGGTGTMTDGNSPYREGAEVTIMTNTFTRANYAFSGWNTANDGSGTSYKAGDTFTISENTTLYAQWVPSYTITPSANNGTIEVYQSSKPAGDTVRLKVTPSSGYALVGLKIKKTSDSSVTDIVPTYNSDLKRYIFTMPDYNVTVKGVFDATNEITYDFSAIDFSDWDNGYSERSVSYPIATVTFAAASKQNSGSTIDDIPVTKGSDVSLVMKESGGDTKKITGATFVCRQWGTKTQTITLHYSTDNGESYTTTGVTSTDFTISKNNLATGTDAVKISFSSSSNQVGIESATILIKGDAHSITCADVLPGGSISSDPTSASQGETVELTATPEANYALDSWTVTYTAGEEIFSIPVTDNKFTMPNFAVNVTASFRSARKLTVQYSINGTVDDGLKQEVTEGGSVDINGIPDGVTPAGYTFAGWSASASDLSTLLAANDSYTPSDNVTLYAVFTATKPAQLSFSITKADFTTTSYDSNDTDKITVAESATGDTIHVKWHSNQIYQNSNAMQWKKSVGYLYNKTSLGTIKSVTVTSSEGSFTTLYGASENTGCASSTVGNGYFKTSVGGATGKTSEVKVTFVKSITRKFTRIISENEDINTTVTLTAPAIIESGQTLTINNGGVLNAGNYLTIDGGTLIIEDGGQLICNNAVAATVKKNITGYGAKAGENNGWLFVASPIAGQVAPSAVSNMMEGEFDLYRFQEGIANGWQNYKNSEASHYHFNLDNGRGYLYANEDGNDLSFAGTITPSSPDVNVDLSYTTEADPKYVGWNLVGNPFTANAYIDWSYYRMVEQDGHVVIDPETSSSGAIRPCEGVMVRATNTGQRVTFTTTAPAQSNQDNGNLQMVLAQTVATRGEGTAQTLDKAIVSFNEGSQLGKFYFGTQDANLYIPQDNEEYAIVSSNAQGEMPVNFKAHRDGQYTITVNPEEVEMGYLHLVDNIAGKEVDLLATPSYSFNAKADDYESRFRLVFSANMVNADLKDDFAFFSNGQLVVANEGEAILQVIDITGRVVATESIHGTCGKAVNVKAGVYVLRLINGTDVKTQKIIVK